MDDNNRILDDSITVLDHIDSQLTSMQKIVLRSKEELLFYKENALEEKNLLRYIEEECTKLYINFILKYQQTYVQLGNLFDVINPFEKKREKIDKELLKKSEFVKATMNEGILYIKFPRLPLQIFRKMYVFEDVLRLVLEDLHIPRMSQKTIYILHVFKKNTSIYRIPDNDNYDFKRYVDIITDYVGGGDAGITTQFVLNSVYCDDIPEGSYFIITPSKNVIKEKKIVKNLKKFFSQK